MSPQNAGICAEIIGLPKERRLCERLKLEWRISRSVFKINCATLEQRKTNSILLSLFLFIFVLFSIYETYSGTFSPTFFTWYKKLKSEKNITHEVNSIIINNIKLACCALHETSLWTRVGEKKRKKGRKSHKKKISFSAVMFQVSSK